MQTHHRQAQPANHLPRHPDRRLLGKSHRPATLTINLPRSIFFVEKALVVRKIVEQRKYGYHTPQIFLGKKFKSGLKETLRLI
jgi:hypothetical protein